MTRSRGTNSGPRVPASTRRSRQADQATDETGASPPARPGHSEPVPLGDLMRRVVAAGLAGVFGPTEVMRRAVGEALPKDWLEFATDQSERTRKEFLERLAGEMARSLESLDLVGMTDQLLAGRVIEVNAQIQIHPRGRKIEGKPLRVSMRRAGEDE